MSEASPDYRRRADPEARVSIARTRPGRAEPDSNEHRQIGGQGAVSWTDPSGADETRDVNAQIVLQWKF